VVEHASDIAKEYYASFTLDRPAKLHLGMLSAEGGVEIEEVAVTNPEAIARLHVNPIEGLDLATATKWVAEANLDPEAREQAAALLVQLYTCYVEGDCDLAEINPLILTTDGEVKALDAKVTLDENASFRHPEWEDYAATDTEDPREKMAKERGLNYIGLEGSVGIIANGAGLAMSTLDVVNQVEAARPTSSTSVGCERRRHGGGARGDQRGPRCARHLRQHLWRDHPRRRGGNGVVAALERVEIRSPIVLRLDGTNAIEGRAILAPHLSERLVAEATMLEAARRVVALAGN